MDTMIERALASRWLWLLARVLLALLFLAGGLAKLIDWEAGLAEVQAAGLNPPWVFSLATALTLIAGAVLVLLDRLVWLAAGGLSVFLLLTIVLVHSFWTSTSEPQQVALYFAFEHLSVIGGLLAAAIASQLRKRVAAVVVL